VKNNKCRVVPSSWWKSVSSSSRKCGATIRRGIGFSGACSIAPTTCVAALLVVALVAMPGCGGRNSDDAMIKDANKRNIQRLTNLYTRHQMQNSSRGPKNEQEFKKYIQGVDSATLKKMGIDPADIDSLFVSDRDQQPFEIRYGIAASFRGDPVGLIFEKQGVNGVRQVGLSTIAVKDVQNDQQYSQLLAGKPYSDGKANPR